MIAPVVASTDKPAVELYAPPVYASVPVNVTACPVVKLVQNGVPAYDIVAVGAVVIIIFAVATTCAHPAAAAIV